MKRFTVPCKFGGQNYPFHIYVGDPSPEHHPLYFQALWLSTVRGGSIPEEVLDSFARLQKIALENKVSFEELCVYALGTAAAKPTTGSPENSTVAEPAPADPKRNGESRVIIVICRQLERDAPSWVIAAVKPANYDECLKRYRAGALNLKDFTEFGEIVVSGPGDKPPEDTTAKVAKTYHTDPQKILYLSMDR